jgi:hypothetical protein
LGQATVDLRLEMVGFVVIGWGRQGRAKNKQSFFSEKWLGKAWNTLDRFGRTWEQPWKALASVLGRLGKISRLPWKALESGKGMKRVKEYLKGILFSRPFRARGVIGLATGDIIPG